MCVTNWFYYTTNYLPPFTILFRSVSVYAPQCLLNMHLEENNLQRLLLIVILHSIPPLQHLLGRSPHIINSRAASILQKSFIFQPLEQSSGQTLYLAGFIRRRRTILSGDDAVFDAQLWSSCKVNADAMNGYLLVLELGRSSPSLEGFPQ